MTPTRWGVLTITTLLAACGAGAQGIPEGYTLVELQPLGGGSESVVSAINDRGQIVGRTEFGTGPVATSWNLAGAASLVTVSGGGGLATDAVWINNEGSMLVECPGCTNDFGVRLADGTLLQLPDPPEDGSATVAPRLTSDGSVGGILADLDDDAAYYGIVWELDAGPSMSVDTYGPVASPPTFQSGGYFGGLLSDAGVQVFGSGFGEGGADIISVDTRTGTQSSVGFGDKAIPRDVNSASEFVAFEGDGGGSWVTVYTPAGSAPVLPINCDDFPSPGDCAVVDSDPVNPGALNDRTLVVGGAVVLVDDGFGFPKPAGASGFIWSAGTGSIDLLDLVVDGSADGWSLLQGGVFDGGPADINTAGVIVGNGINPMGQPAAYVLIPRSPCAADANRDGLVTPADYNAWILSFNNGCD